MRITETSDAELRALGDLVGVSDLNTAVQHLLQEFTSAVPSCLAMRVTSAAAGGCQIESEGFDATRSDTRASLRLDLSLSLALQGAAFPTDDDLAACVLILAAEDGAFADFVGGADPLARPDVRIVRRTVDGDMSTGPWNPTKRDGPGCRPADTERDDPRDRRLDGHLNDQLDGGVAPLRVIHRAVGVLIDRGHLPGEAMAVLRQQAHEAGHSLAEQASAVIGSVSYRP